MAGRGWRRSAVGMLVAVLVGMGCAPAWGDDGSRPAGSPSRDRVTAPVVAGDRAGQVAARDAAKAAQVVIEAATPPGSTMTATD